MGKTECVPFENWHKIRVYSLTTPIPHSIGSYGPGNQARETNKGDSNRKRGSQIISADDMMVYLENPSISAQNLLKLISNFNRKSQESKSMCKNHKHSYTSVINKWKNIAYSWIGIINIMKIAICPK